jgi:hypothetical protein
MKYLIEKDEVVLLPDNEFDIYKIGILHNKYGGRIKVEDQKVTSYKINCNIILDFMLLRADNGEK